MKKKKKKGPMSNNLKEEADHPMYLTSILMVLEEVEVTFQIWCCILELV